MQPGVSRNDVSLTNLKLYGATGEALDIKGQQSVSFDLDGREFRHMFLVCELPTDTTGLFGTEVMQVMQVKLSVLNFENFKISYGHRNSATRVL